MCIRTRCEYQNKKKIANRMHIIVQFSDFCLIILKLDSSGGSSNLELRTNFNELDKSKRVGY